jgi:tRNA threonylcarbamoyl adenosine modification protein YeaZ/ribosomal-protein-alanine acetyltransferase
MTILALETATRRGSIAIWRDGVTAVHEGDAARTHGERLPAEIVRLLEEHGLTLRDVDLFAVIVGPGSFTGLRVGVAAVQGLALVAGRQVVAVPTLEALCHAARANGTPAAAILVPCVDGQRGEVFFAAVDPASGGAAWIEPRAGKPEDLIEAVQELGREGPAWLIGDGARRYESVFRNGLPGASVADSPMPLAQAAAAIAAARPDDAVAPHALRPIYLRRPDAVLARERARAAVGDGYRIRRIVPGDDLAGVERLQQLTFTNPWGAEAIRWELEHTDVARLYVLEVPSGEIAAYCACWIIFDELHINSLAVDSARRRQGLARRLLEYALADAARQGGRTATLEVRASNAAARALYEGMGYRVEGVRRDYYQDPREDALILWKRG